MTTATRTNPKAKLDAAEKQLAEARGNRAKRGEESRAWALDLQRAEGELNLIAATDPDQ